MKEAILRTLAYADAAEMPLTAYESWRYSIGGNPKSEILNPKLFDVIRTLDELVRQETIIEQDGYYAFPDRKELIRERLERLQIHTLKLKRAKRWAHWLVRLPYVRGVFAYGSLATGNTKEDSDLDILVVVTPGRMFTARLFVTWFTEIFGVRRTRTVVKDRICLNHYVTEEMLGVPEAYRNLPTAWLWSRMFPLALRHAELEERFLDKNNWISEYFPHLYLGRSATQNNAERHAEQRRSFFGDRVEYVLRSLQLRRIKKNPLTYKEGGRVVANDDMLIFHPELPEERRMRVYHERLKKLGIVQ